MLYVVGTPIGNLNDLSLRQAKILAQASVIITEDTRSTGLLLARIEELFGFKPNPGRKLVSYYKENEFEKLPLILKMLEEETEIILISQAGMPLVSDPGSLLMKEVIRRNLPYTVIPGPTAVTTAIVHSGFLFSHFLFYGFLPKKETDLKKAIAYSREASLKLKNCMCVYYESSARVNKTLEILSHDSPDAQVCVCRELTKLHEESIRGKPHELKERIYKGEIVLVVSY